IFNMFNLKVYVPARLSFSAGIRDLILEAGNLAGFADRQINMLRLVVDELFMNAIRYGSNDQSHVFLEMYIEEGKIIAAIEDDGEGKKRIKAEDLKKILDDQTADASLHKSHGRGLAQITSQLVQKLEILDKDNGGLRIEFLMEKQNFPKEEFKPEVKRRTNKVLPEVEIGFSGSIDLDNLEENAIKVQEVFAKHAGETFRLILDFAELEYCNSSFISYLANWQYELDKIGGEIIIKNPNNAVYEIIDLVGLSFILVIERD
ncbi:MAG TPA: ATP-binding protein, partial [Candidatus Gracilibacteria bacterium]|nr:ATP-binding protein [Candidatus Gracilibacteria bacterium]